MFLKSKNLSKFSGLVVFLLVLATGLIDLREPFAGDQALFVTGATAMTRGAVLYRDFWDLKQPGIYGFYWLGIHFPGSTEVAVHSLEVLYFAAFALVIFVSLRSWFVGRQFAALAAVLVCGIYFIICSSWHLTQVEGLVGFPLYLCAWLMLAAGRRVFVGRLFLAGLAVAWVAMLKLMLVVLPGCLFLMMLVRERQNRRTLIGCLSGILCLSLGVAIVAGPVVYFFAAHDQLSLLYSTFVDDPMRIARELPHNPLSVFRAGIFWFASRMGLLLPLACIGAYRKRKDLLGCGLVVWIIVGFALIFIQRMGWEYHFLLMLCPIGILAAAGVEQLIESALEKRSQPAGRLLAAIPVLLLSPYLAAGLVRTGMHVHDPRPGFYAETDQVTAILNTSHSKAGAIYVLGDPLIYYRSNRPQAVAINGWSPEWLLDDQWKELAGELRMARPVYIFVSHENRHFLVDRGRGVGRVIGDLYCKVGDDNDGGDWFALREPNR